MQRLDPKTKGQATLIAIRLTPELDEWIKRQSKGMSKSEFIRKCLKDKMESEE